MPSKGMIRIARFGCQGVVKRIGKTYWRLWQKGKVYRVRMSTARMLLMKRSLNCACCGLPGTHFWLEYSGTFPPHFNLYGTKNGQEIMLTVDHIKPKSAGGETVQENLQLLCCRCNSAKKNDQISLEELRKRRGLFSKTHSTRSNPWGADVSRLLK